MFIATVVIVLNYFFNAIFWEKLRILCWRRRDVPKKELSHKHSDSERQQSYKDTHWNMTHGRLSNSQSLTQRFQTFGERALPTRKHRRVAQGERTGLRFTQLLHEV